MENKKIFLCDCHTLEHQLVIHQIDEDVYFHFYISPPFLPFFQRIKNFFSFVFKKKKKYDDNMYIIFNKNEEKAILDYLEEILKRLKKDDNDKEFFREREQTRDTRNFTETY